MRIERWTIAGLLFIAFCEWGCKPDHQSLALPVDRAVDVAVPDHFPALAVPQANALTEKRITLGRRLFFDTRLSRTGTVSCSSCHLPAQAFADVTAVSFGVDGMAGDRNAPSLGNVGYAPALNADGGVPSLELQVLVPLHDENELDFNDPEAVAALGQDPVYTRLSEVAYGRDFDNFVITRALAAFQRTLISGNSKYDRVQLGLDTFSEEEQAGLDLFTSETTQCASCHSGVFQTDFDYANVGLYADYPDLGRQLVTTNSEDGGKFKTPSLRNVALTAPYMHDGSLATLGEVIAHFNAGGVGHPNQDPRIQPLGLDAAQQGQLLAFLHTLSDSTFLANPAYQPLD